MTTSTRPWGAAPLRRLRPELPVLVSAGAAIVLVATLTLAQRGDEVPLFLTHVVVLFVAAGPAYLLDDIAEAVTAVVPRSLLRRRLVIVGNGLLIAAVGWAAVALLLHWRSPSVPLTALTWETAGLISIGLAASAVASRYGVSEPGNLVASALGLVVVGVLVAQPLLSFTALITTSDGRPRAGWWATTICAAALAFVITSREGGRSRSVSFRRRRDSPAPRA